MPVISPRRSSSTTSGSLYVPHTTSGAFSSSLANKTNSNNILSSSSSPSGYSSTYRSNGLSKTPATSSYSSYHTSSYLPRTSGYSSVGRSSFSSTSASALTGGSSALSSYRLNSYLSGGNNDTTSASRFGRDLEHRTGTENTDSNNYNNDYTRSQRSSSKSRNSRLSSSFSSSSLARLVATSALEIYEKYSPAHYIPKCELSRSSSLSEAAASATTATSKSAAATSSTLRDTNNTNSIGSNSIKRNDSYNKRYSRLINGTIDEDNEIHTSNSSSSIIDSYISVPRTNSNNNLNNNHSGSSKLLLHANYDLQDDSNSLRDLKISCISSPITTTNTATTTLGATSTTASSSNSRDTKDNPQLAVKQKRSVEATATTITTTTSSTTSTTNNSSPNSINKVTAVTSTNSSSNNSSPGSKISAAKAGNQQFFLTSAFKDQNFLKNECDLARSQVYRSRQKFNNNNLNDDTYNNNNDNINNNNNNSPGGSNNFINENGLSLAGSNSSIVNNINDNRKIGVSSKHLSAIKPLIHQIQNNIFSIKQQPAKNNNNNNMHCLHSNSELLDDIKYIDSDDTERQQQQQQQQQYQPRQQKPKQRPKSSIISTSNQNLFEKINQYKYQNGSTLSSSPPVSLSAPTSTSSTATSSPSSTLPLMGGRRHDIIHDTLSIKASIEKFNTLSEAKGLPTRNSTTNLQLNNDYERRIPFRERSASPANSSCGSTIAVRGSIIPSNLSASNSTSSGSLVSNNILLRNRSTESSPSHSPKNLRKTSVTPTAALLNGSTSNLLKSTTSTTTTVTTYDKVTLTTVSMLSCPTATLSTVTSKTISNDKKPPTSVSTSASPSTSSSNKLTDIDESVRNSSSLRSGLPPISPTPSRHWERDSSSRSSLLSSRNLSDDYSSSSKLTSNEKSDQEGLCGLRNIGNTCFMNSVIQCLSHTSELTKFLKTLNGVRSSPTKDQQILSEFAKLIREMWSPNVTSVTPRELKQAFSSKHRMYSDYNQQDAQEFLRFFLDSLHSALNSGVKGEHLKIDESLSDNKKAEITWDWYTKAENSVIRDLFVGQLKSTLRCTVCGNTSVTFDPFWDLSVSLPSMSRCKLEACLDLFIREEVLDGEEMPTCSKCQTRRKSTKSFTIQRFPKYLVIHLKRFSETRWSKLSNIVEFPTGERELNMGPYASNPSTNAYYSLYAISNHMGSTAGGHYVALCKHPITKKWHEFNDNIVSGELSTSHLVSSSAYILFFERAHRPSGELNPAINFLSHRKSFKRTQHHKHTVSSYENYNNKSSPCEASTNYQIHRHSVNFQNNYNDRHNKIYSYSYLVNVLIGITFYAIFFTSCYYLFLKSGA